MVILFFERFKRLFENFLPTHRIDHRHLYAGQFNIGRQNIHAFTVTQDCPAHIIRRIRHLRKHRGRERVLQAVGCAQPVLTVKLPCGSQSTSSTFFPSCASPTPRFRQDVVLPTPAFLVAEGSNCCFHFLIFLLSMQKAAAFSSRALSSILLSFQSNSRFCHLFSLKRRFYDFQPRYVASSVRVFSQISSAITLQFFAFIPAAFPTASSSFIPGFLPFPSTVVLCSPK